MEIAFILYKPAVPGNVGAAARAIKTMGFRTLRLIDPCNHLAEEARMMAHGSVDILERAEIYEDFDAAVKDIDLIVGTTAKKRTAKEDYYSPGELMGIIKSKSETIQKAGILFGTEESGLPNDLLLQSDLASSIPLDKPYPSLNLGQAVMLYAYELSPLRQISGKQIQPVSESYSELKVRIEELLKKSGITADSALYNRIMERFATIDSNDINLLHSITSRLGKLIDKS